MRNKAVRGGRYKPLHEEEIKKIDEVCMRVFEEIGIEVNSEEAIGYFKKAGASVDRDGRHLKIPRGLVRKAVEKAPSSITLCGRKSENDLVLEDSRVHVGTGGTALNVLDLNSGQKRRSSINDLRDFGKLVDALDNIHFYMLPVYPHEIPKEQVDVNRFYAGLSNTSKHITGGVYTKEGVRKVIRMAETISGSPGELRSRPLISMVTCIMSPLKMDREYTELLIEIARSGIPLITPAESLSGATAPVTLAGTLVTMNVETLSGIVLAQLVNPGTPVLYGCIATITELKRMGYLSGAIEMGIMNAAAAQLAQFYAVPCYTTAGMSDAKVPDVQAGFEKMGTVMLNALAGANYIHDAAGFLEFCMTASYEQCVIDNEILGMALRAVEGINLNEENLAFDIIKKVGPGGHFLAERHTVEHMRQEFFIPEIADRNLREKWEEMGGKDAVHRAREKVRQILASHQPECIPEEMDQQLRHEAGGIV